VATAFCEERLTRHRAETEGVVEFPIGEQSRVGGDRRSAKLERQSAVEIEPENALLDSPAGFDMIEASA
jgi:hypothetical protein